MKIRKAVLLLACAVSWGIAVWFAGRLWAAYPLVSVRSDVPVTGRQLEALRSALRQEDGASALVPAFWSQAEGSAESRWETCGITAILYCGEYDAVYPAVLLEGRFPAAQENGKCAVSTAAAWQLWGSEDVLGQELEIEGDIYRVCGLFRSSASLALCGESLDHGLPNPASCRRHREQQANQAIHAMRPIGRLRRCQRPFQRNLFAYPSDSPFIRFIIKREQIPQNVNSIYILQDLLSLLFERPLKKQKRRITNGIRI